MLAHRNPQRQDASSVVFNAITIYYAVAVNSEKKTYTMRISPTHHISSSAPRSVRLQAQLPASPEHKHSAALKVRKHVPEHGLSCCRTREEILLCLVEKQNVK